MPADTRGWTMLSMSYDAIVVGARCAGAPTAMLLARRGYRVLLLDKAGFPSDTLSTHYVHQPGVARLAKWGMLDRVIESNAPPVPQIKFDFGEFALVGAPPPFDGATNAYAPRRRVLDTILVEAAVEAGVELREHFAVESLLTDGECVTGVRGHAVGGATVSEQAPIVIGADGLRSLVARSVGAETYRRVPSLTCAFYTYWADLPVKGSELYPRPGHMLVTSPTNDGRTITIAFWPRAEFEAVRADVEGAFWAAVELVPTFAERLRAAKRVERFAGTTDLPNQFRQSFGPGWALVGDAGYHKDPILALGISDAFREAEWLSDAVDAGLSRRTPMIEALAGYQHRRDEDCLPSFQLTCEIARLAPPPPEMQALFFALREDQEQTNRFFGAVAGTVPIPEFYAPENIARIMGEMAA
jgi:2-polyprenyl-6-methoxyphenol hydroxylase-like FAD-dependent oxidoreductase